MRFWEARSRLLPDIFQAAKPLIQPIGDELDRTIAAVLKERGLNTATYGQSACRGLAERPRLQPLRLVVGEGLAPYREMRAFWIPFAIEYAHIQSKAQADRRNRIVARVGPLRGAIDELRRSIDAFESSFLYSHGAVWERSPFEPRFLPHSVENAISNLKDLFQTRNALPATELSAALAQLEDLAARDIDYELHGNADVWGCAFVAIITLAWVRLTGKKPHIDKKAFRGFLEDTWAAIECVWKDHNRRGSFDAACKNVANAPIHWKKFCRLSWLIEHTPGTWRCILESSNIDDKHGILDNIIHEEDMLPMRERRLIDHTFAKVYSDEYNFDVTGSPWDSYLRLCIAVAGLLNCNEMNRNVKTDRSS